MTINNIFLQKWYSVNMLLSTLRFTHFFYAFVSASGRNTLDMCIWQDFHCLSSWGELTAGVFTSNPLLTIHPNWKCESINQDNILQYMVGSKRSILKWCFKGGQVTSLGCGDPSLPRQRRMKKKESAKQWDL